jgi:hypothetical protein
MALEFEMQLGLTTKRQEPITALENAAVHEKPIAIALNDSSAGSVHVADEITEFQHRLCQNAGRTPLAIVLYLGCTEADERTRLRTANDSGRAFKK